jgi:hypothetical protein
MHKMRQICLAHEDLAFAVGHIDAVAYDCYVWACVQERQPPFVDTLEAAMSFGGYDCWPTYDEKMIGTT